MKVSQQNSMALDVSNVADAAEQPLVVEPVVSVEIRGLSVATTSLTLLAGNRQPSESDAAVLACNDYLRRGRFRSLRQLLAFYDEQADAIYGESSPQEQALLGSKYTDIHQNTPKMPLSRASKLNSSSHKNPASSLEILKHWSSRFSWQERARLFNCSNYSPKSCV